MKSVPLALAILALGLSAARAQGFVEPAHPVAPGDVKPSIAVGPIDVVAPAAPTAPQGETTLTLDVGYGIRYVPASRVTVPAGERLQIIAPRSDAASVRYTWTKDGQPIAGAPSANVLVIDYTTSSDAGTYVCSTSTPTGSPLPSQQLILGVGPTSRLLNISMRGALEMGVGKSFVAGFVVASPGSASKKMIVRAVGPTLARFGVGNPLAKPVLRIFDGAGRPYTNGYVYPAVVGGPTYEADLASSLAAVGAFPTPPDSADAVLLMPFLPGSYTAQVTSADNGAGEVLIEIYEVP